MLRGRGPDLLGHRIRPVTIVDGRITEFDAVGDPQTIARLAIAVIAD